MQKDNVIDKPELFGTTDEEYEKNKVAGHFKFIVSPENQNVNLKVLINDFIKRIEKLSGYELYWQACIHTDTEHHHGHIVINRKDKNGRRIYFPKQMIKNTMREILLYHFSKTGGRFIKKSPIKFGAYRLINGWRINSILDSFLFLIWHK
ncbi:MAG: relaxase/mobilization nuclease domain-containing protein [Treponema sp.]|nr:relaxase/mobilization nuclease domain-containing protein [Treponema sp.]